MLYTPLPGTPLHDELTAQGRMKDDHEFEAGDIHGQYIFNYRHPHIHDGQESELIVRAFQRDFEANGPSLARIARTLLAGWQRYKNHPDRRIRRRFEWESRELPTVYSAAVSAMKWYYRRTPAMRAKMSQLLHDLYREFGWQSRLAAALGGPYLLWKIRQEEERLGRGWTYEPPTFYEKNDRVAPAKDSPRADRCRYVTPRLAPENSGTARPSSPVKTLAPASTGPA